MSLTITNPRPVFALGSADRMTGVPGAAS